MVSTNIQGFRVIPLYFSQDSSSHHEIFIKEHSVRTYDEKKPRGKTLFVLNIPPYATEENFKNVFSAAGKIKTVHLQDNLSESDNNSNCGFKVGYVVFERNEGLLKSLKLESLKPLSSPKSLLLGLNKWIYQYNSTIYNHDKLNNEVNGFIKKSDKQEENTAKGKEEVDDEGWTVVSKKGRNPGLSRKESVENKLIQKTTIRNRKKELKNFYTFQLKEQKMKNIIALRKNFQDSKEKVNLMKKMRNFKPY